MTAPPITVLIEQADFVPFTSPLRRSSFTPGLGSLAHVAAHAHHGVHGGGAHQQHYSGNDSPRGSMNSINGLIGNSSSSPAFGSGGAVDTVATASGRNANRNSMTAGGSNHSAKEWNRRQRTSTTFHASIDVPDSLLAALSSIAIVNIQPSLAPLPPSRPLVVLIQLNDYIPQELSTTPSTVCFPPNATPTKQSVQRAIQPLKTIRSQLDAIGARGEAALLLYSDNAHLPPEIPQAAFADGAHGLLTPPFTPDSVQSALHAALALYESKKLEPAPPNANAEADARREERRRERERITGLGQSRIGRGDRDRTRVHHQKYDSLESFTLSSSSSHSHGDAAPPPPATPSTFGPPDVYDSPVDPLDTSRRRSDLPLPSSSSFPLASTLEGSEPTYSYSGNHDEEEGKVPFPPREYMRPRRASVDIGGLGLALPRGPSTLTSTSPYQSPSSPFTVPVGAGAGAGVGMPRNRSSSYGRSPSLPQTPSSRDRSSSYSRLSPTTSDELDITTSSLPSSWATASGWGWAGFDTDPDAIALHALSLFGPAPSTTAVSGPGPWGRRGTVVPGRATADVKALGAKAVAGRKGSVNPGMFDVDFEDEEGDGLGVADLLLAMHLHGTAALENATAMSSTTTGTTGNRSPTSNPPSYFPSSNTGAATNGPAHQRRQSSPTPGAPAMATTSSFTPALPQPLPFPSILTATPRALSRLRALLSSWHFEPYLLSPPETLLCVQLVFQALLGGLKLSDELTGKSVDGGPSSSPITMADHLVPFLTNLMRLYRRENRYHSFVHALDVLQAVYTFLELQGRVDSVAVAFLDTSGEGDADVYGDGVGGGKARSLEEKGGGANPLGLLSDDDLFLLCIAAIGHDVGHPGNSNAFLKNAQAPLSKLYEDKSALERMHCTLLLRLLRKHGMGHLISSQTAKGRDGRWLIVGTVLATDMSWHFEWVERFGRAMKDRRAIDQQSKGVLSAGGSPDLVVNSSGSGAWVVVEQDREAPVPGTDETNEPDAPEELSQEEVDREDRLFMCQAMMKCADISNPCRPHNISRHWSTVLLEEWAAQALLERHLGLPVSVVADANEKVQCVGQVSFIKLFTQPLFDIVAGALPGLSVIAKQCTENRILWENRLSSFEAIASTQAASPSNRTSSASSSKSIQQMIRPIPLALPLLPSMARYAKTVFPLSLPSLRTKKLPPAARALASMSPWHSVSRGKKKTATTASFMTTSQSNTSGTSGQTSGSGHVWSRSRPESFSSSSTLSSVGGTGGGLSPTTPTSTTGMPTNSIYGRSPVSPLMSPFSMSMAVSSMALGGNPGPGTGPQQQQPLSVWDVNPTFAEQLRREVRRAWEMRDGRARKNARGRMRLVEGSLEDGEDTFPLRRGSLDIAVG